MTGLNLIIKQLLQSVLMGAVLPAVAFSMVSGVSVKDPAVPPSTNEKRYAQSLQIPVLQKDGGVETMELEAYITNVVLGEVSSGFHVEALKAQAVAARTYTLRCIESGNKHEESAVCTDYHCCQAYQAPEEYLKEGGTQEGLRKVENAVEATASEVLCYNDVLITATYFASSGGLTEDAEEVWGQSYPYLKPVSSPGEEECGYFSQQTTLSPQELQELLGVSLTGKPPSWFGMVTYTEGGGVDLMRIGGKLYTGVELRQLLGLRSTVFEVTPTDEVILIETKGYGHRVGMSQHGANSMASAGSTYQEILSHYYIGTTLQQYTPRND